MQSKILRNCLTFFILMTEEATASSASAWLWPCRYKCRFCSWHVYFNNNQPTIKIGFSFMPAFLGHVYVSQLCKVCFFLSNQNKARPKESYWVFFALRYLITGGSYAAHHQIDVTFRMGILG